MGHSIPTMMSTDIDAVIAAIGRGEMIVLVDDEDRENEGDLVMAAEFVEPQHIAFMASQGRGLICLAMDGDMIDRLGLPMMTTNNASRLGTAFTVSIEAACGVTTGISAADRARTIQAAIAQDAGPHSVVVPGHIFPLRAVPGGALVRAGQTEGSVDLARLAGCRPAAVICEIMHEDGTMARRPALEDFCRQHNLLLSSVADLIAWRERRESLIERLGEAELDSPWGRCTARVYRSTVDDRQHMALVFGPQTLLQGQDPVLVRVHRRQTICDLLRLDGDGISLDQAGQLLAGQGGVLLYLDHDRHDLATQLDIAAGAAPPPGPDIHRDHGIGAQILRDLGLRRLRLITTSDAPVHGLAGHDLEIVSRVTTASINASPTSATMNDEHHAT